MAKEYVIFHTDTAVIVPIKAEFYGTSYNPAYQATFPQFFGGTVDSHHTLKDEVEEESQGQLTLSGLKLLTYSTIIGSEQYKFYSRKLPELPHIQPLQTTGRPANQLEMQDIRVFPKTVFEGTFTVDKLIELCRAVNPRYCDQSKCLNSDGSCQWNDDGTKNAFAAFLSNWSH